MHPSKKYRIFHISLLLLYNVHVRFIFIYPSIKHKTVRAEERERKSFSFQKNIKYIFDIISKCVWVCAGFWYDVMREVFRVSFLRFFVRFPTTSRTKNSLSSGFLEILFYYKFVWSEYFLMRKFSTTLWVGSGTLLTTKFGSY